MIVKLTFGPEIVKSILEGSHDKEKLATSKLYKRILNSVPVAQWIPESDIPDPSTLEFGTDGVLVFKDIDSRTKLLLVSDRLLLIILTHGNLTI